MCLSIPRFLEYSVTFGCFVVCKCSPLSESARTVGSGLAVPASCSGCISMDEIFKVAVSSFKVHDWSLFGSAAGPTFS